MKFFGKDKPGSKVVIKGVPFESISFSQGCALAPSFLRYCAEAIETKSSFLNKICEDFEDTGDIPCYGIDFDEALKIMEEKAEIILKDKKSIIFIGGDHTITYPLFKTAKKIYPKLKLLILDAHTDFRDKFMESKLNHATWLKKLYEEKIVKEEEVYIYGVRENFPEVPFNLIKEIDDFKNLKGNFYLSFDLDVLDPSIFSSVSNPFPGGPSFKEIIYILNIIAKNLIASDFVEYNPLRGDALNSGIIFSIIVRELIALLSD